MSNTYCYPTALEPINAKIYLPGSKSITNRALLISSLAKGTSCLRNFLISEDTIAMKTSLENLKISISFNGRDSCIIEGCSGKFKSQSARILCQDAGTVLRFLLPACAYSSGIFHFEGSDQLTSRPIRPLISVLSKQGAEFRFLTEEGHLPFSVQGIKNSPIKQLEIPGDISSQFLSGLLMSAPLLQEEIYIKTKNLISKPYVKMTCAIMKKFGVSVEEMEEDLFHIPESQTYQGIDYRIEPDLSTASYFFSAAALTHGEITLQGINKEDCQQGDIAFLEILERMGCKVFCTQNSITVCGTSQLKGITINMSDCSDLFMTVACLAAFADTPTIIEGVNHIRLKESDRILSTKSNLKLLGVELIENYSENLIKILPAKPSSGILNSFDDHRIVMAFALFGLKIPNIMMKNSSCVNKTCPDFFHRWEAMLSLQGNNHGI